MSKRSCGLRYLKDQYLEEALAETYAQLRVRGVSRANIVQGIRFPVGNGYVSVVQLVTESKGLLLGPINVGGSVYNVLYSAR